MPNLTLDNAPRENLSHGGMHGYIQSHAELVKLGIESEEGSRGDENIPPTLPVALGDKEKVAS